MNRNAQALREPPVRLVFCLKLGQSGARAKALGHAGSNGSIVSWDKEPA